MFDITNAMIQLLNLKGVFAGLPNDDINVYLINFIGICSSHTITWVDKEDLRLRFFPFSLTGEATLLLGELF